MTNELIERYLKNNCTEQERKTVEEWLNSTESEETTLSEESLAEMSSGIWASVKKEIPFLRFRINRFNRPKAAKFVAAASVIIGVAGFHLISGYKNTSVSIALMNNRYSYELKRESRFFDFYLKPNSSVQGNVSDLTGKGNLDFSGSLSMVNTSEKTLEIAFRAERSNPPSIKKIALEKSKLYHVGILKKAHSNDEILVMSDEEMAELPPRIKVMAFCDDSI